MTRDEFNKVFNYIRNEYSDFEGDYDEWYGILSEYAYEDILKKVKERRTSTAPIHTHLIKGLKKEEVVEPKYIECDLCGELILVGRDWDVFEKHHRRCEKIDFIDRQSKKIHNAGITKSVYYGMTDEELEKNYRAYMNNWIKTHQDIAFNPEGIVKKI